MGRGAGEEQLWERRKENMQSGLDLKTQTQARRWRRKRKVAKRKAVREIRVRKGKMM